MRYPPEIGQELCAIFTPSLISYANKITFPWSFNEDLNGSIIGDVFFGDHDSFAEWFSPKVKIALIALSKIGTINIRAQDLVYLLHRDHTLTPLGRLERAVGIILILDQGTRNICKGTNGRYIYQYFDVIARNLVDILLSLPESECPFSISAWKLAGVAITHASLRISMIMAPIVHSEVLSDHYLHLRMTEDWRSQLEKLTGIVDPHRETFEVDLNDIYGMAELLRNGPPKRSDVTTQDFFYWIMRYFTFHTPYIRKFGRSPFRNVSVGRDDVGDEIEWLERCGTTWSPDDEVVRGLIYADVERGGWSPLKF